jgi:MHS family proline/betaine transporter-like MFS transporter
MSNVSHTNPHLVRNTVGGVIGNVLEWYDFAVFGYFAPVIGAQFFPSDDYLVATIKAFGVFAAGYLMRPLGGVLFGFIGDRLGRKKALEISVLMMALPTTLIGLLPVYDQVGMWAAVMLVALRLIQGVSVGGEYIGSISFSTEIAPPNRRGLWGALAGSGASIGIMFGSVVATVAHWTFAPAELAAWGWRIPFLFGIFMGIFSFWVRSGLVESEDFAKIKQSGKIQKNPIIETLRTYSIQILHIVALLMIYGGGFYIILVWWPTYLAKIVDPPIPHAFFMNTIAILVLTFLGPLSGLISDFVGRKVIVATCTIGLIVVVYPLTVWTDHGQFVPALISQMIMTVFMAGLVGPMAAILAGSFPTQNRYSGIAIPYNLTVGIVGGTAPMLCTWMVGGTGNVAAPAYYVMLLGIISLVAAIVVQERKSEEHF